MHFSQVWPEANWWQGFGNPELTALVAQAQTDNRDLAAERARKRRRVLPDELLVTWHEVPGRVLRHRFAEGFVVLAEQGPLHRTRG